MVANKASGDFLPATTYDNAVSVVITANTLFANLDVMLDNDSKFESAGAITATIIAETGGGTPTYSLATADSAEIAVTSEDEDVPIISISSAAEANGATEGLEFNFTVTSDRDLGGTPLEISFNVNHSITGATIAVADVTIPGDMRTASGTVSLSGVNVDSDTDIEVEITETATYDVSPSDPSIMVSVKDNDSPSGTRPNMSISAVNYIADGETITFTVEASHMPDTTTTVNVVLTGASFIEDGRSLTEPVEISSSEESDTFTVVTKSGSVSSGDGLITATIAEGSNYTRSSTEFATSVAVVDDLPVISISEVSPVNKSVGIFSFMLTSSIAAKVGLPIVIDTLTVDDTSTTGPQYYTSHTPTEIVITDSSTGNAEEVRVTFTADNSQYEGWGEITVSLANGADYTADPNANSQAVTIVDQQTAPISVALDAPVSVVEEDNIEIILTATNTSSSEQMIIVDLEATDVDGTYLNYNNPGVQMTVAAMGTATLPVTELIPTSDVASSSAGEISIVVKRGNGYETASTTPASVMVLAKEELPSVTIAPVNTNSITEGDDAVYTVTATGELSADLIVAMTATQGTGEDFLAGTHPATVTVDMTSKTAEYRVPTSGDDTDEANGTITATIGDDPKKADRTMNATYLRGSPASADVTVEDDDVAELSIADSSTNEGNETNGTIEFTPRLTKASAEDVMITYSFAPSGTNPVDASDYTATDGTIEITAGDLTPLDGSGNIETISVTTIADDTPEYDETFTLTYSAVNATVADNTAEGTITNDDGIGLSIAPVRMVEGNSGDTTNFEFTVSVVPTSSDEIMYSWATSDGTGETGAIAGADYTTSGDTETIIAGSADDTISVPITVDDVAELDETFTVTLTLPQDATNVKLVNGTTTGTILNDDGIEFTIADGTLAEGPTGATNNVMTFAVTAGAAIPADETISLNWETSVIQDVDTATADTDFTSVASGTVSFSDQDQGLTKNIEVTIIGDDTPEADETFTVTLTGASLGGQISTTAGSAKGTITNDDGSLLTIVDASGDEGAASADGSGDGKVTFTVTAFPNPPADLTATWTVTEEDGANAAMETDDYTSTSGTVTISPSQTAGTPATGTFDVVTTGDDTPEFDETFTVTLSNPGAGAQILPNTTAQGTISNDDGTGLSIADVSLEEGDTDGTVMMNFVVTTIPPSDAEIMYTWATSDGTGETGAEAGTDYTMSGATETIAIGAASDTFSVDIVSDDVAEVDETFTVTLSSPTSTSEVSLLNDSAQGIILNDDGIEFSIANGSDPEGDSGDTDKVSFTITASSAVTSGSVILKWVTSIEDGDTAEVDDFTAVTAGTVEFDNTTGTTKDIEVTIVGDDMPEADETFTVTLTEVSIGGQISKSIATGTIENDDGIGLRIADVSDPEGDSGESNMVFTVEAVPPVPVGGEAVTFDWTTKDATGDNLATEGTDYTMNSGDDVSIGAGMSSVDITVAISGDNESEYDEIFIVELSDQKTSGSDTITLLNATATGTIENDDGTTITIAAASIDEGDDPQTPAKMTFMVRAVPSSSDGFTATWTTSIVDGEDNASADDFSGGTGTVSIPADSEDGTFTIDITGDTTPEEDEKFTVTLSEPSTGATISTDMGSTKGTITNDDGIGLSIADASIDEGDTGDPDKNLEFTITVFPTSSNVLTYTWATSVETADPADNAAVDTDFMTSGGTDVTIPINTGEVKVSVPIKGDNELEDNETFTVTLSNASSAGANEDVTLVKASAKGTINDNDGPVLSFDPVTVSVDEGADGDTPTMTFTVKADPAPTSDVTVKWATSVVMTDPADTAEEGVDYTKGDGTLMFAATETSKTFTVALIGDDTPEPDETFTVTLSAITGTGASLHDTNNVAKGTITNDDGSELSIAAASLPEGDGTSGGSMMFTVTAFPPVPSTATEALTATWSTSIEEGDTATADTDFVSQANQTVSIAAGTESSTIAVQIIADETPEFDETFTVTLSNPSTGASIKSDAGSAKGTIENDDGTGLSIAAAELAEGAAGETANMVFTVTTVPPSSDAITYSWATSVASDDNATEGTDFRASSGTDISIAANATESTFNVPILGDDDSEGPETFTVTLSSPTGASLLVPQAKGTIIDDDAPPVLPVVTIAADNGHVDENLGPASFELTAANLTADTTLTINATPDQGDLDFLEEELLVLPKILQLNLPTQMQMVHILVRYP